MQTPKGARWTIAIYAVLAGCVLPCLAQQHPRANVAHRAASVSPQRAEQLIGVSARRAVAALQKNDTATLARLMHPKGLRLAPYMNFSKSDLLLSRSTVAGLRRSPRLYLWGTAEGSGDPIRLPWNAFRLQYLTPKGKNFLAGKANFNTVNTYGSLINNLRETYPDALFVEFHLAGTPKYGDMDWRGLWLVWRQVGKKWYLCAVAGDQWTP